MLLSSRSAIWPCRVLSLGIDMRFSVVPLGLTGREGLRSRAREIHIRTDWRKVIILTLIGCCAFAMLLFVIDVGESRM